MPYPVRLGHDLIELVERYPAEKLPHTGGTAATIVVTMTPDRLTTGLTTGLGTTDTLPQENGGGCAPGLPRLPLPPTTA